MFQGRVYIETKLLFILISLLVFSIPTSAQIDNCCFVDRLCMTEDEWVAGYWAYQNNQCPVSSQSQSQSAASDAIDNCCSVDRQCATAEDYVAGYYAFRNSQCGQPSQNNNCCFRGWQCSSEHDWVSGYWAFQYDQCHPPAPEQEGDQAPRQIDGKPILDRSRRSDNYQQRDSGEISAVSQLCARNPWANWCQNPENFPDFWQLFYPDIWKKIQEELNDE